MMNAASLDSVSGGFNNPHEISAFTSQQHYSHEEVPSQIPDNMQPYQYTHHNDKSQADHIMRAQMTNNQIMGHRMSNMNSFQDTTTTPSFQQLPSQQQVQQLQYADQKNHIQFDNSMPGDSATAPRLRSDPMPQQNHPKYYPSRQMGGDGSGGGGGMRNVRDCRCRPGQSTCGNCMVCGLPGHIRVVPGKTYSSKLAAWCDPHYEGAKREEMKRNPGAFLSYQTFEYNPSSMNPDNPQNSLGPPLTINPNAAQFKNAPKIPLAANNGVSINQHMANTNYHHDSITGPDQMYSHHSDRQLSAPHINLPNSQGRQPISQGQGQVQMNQAQMNHMNNKNRNVTPTSLPPNAPNPYQLTPENMDNFKGGHNPFALSRTSIKPGTLGPAERIDYVGFNAQGEKVHDPSYYRDTPGRVNEFDHYREYKSKYQGGDYQPSNQHLVNSQLRPYQGNIPPKKAKLSGNNLQSFQK
ncbi:MAG: hypothetical protein WD512_18105 [Candidatus Paceibacterota bacterium]